MKIRAAKQVACGLSILVLATSTATTRSLAMTSAATTAAVPTRMMLSQSMRDSIAAGGGLYKAPLAQIQFSKPDAVTGDVKVTESDTNTTLQNVAMTTTMMGAPSVCFVVRRPG
jgi:hypothetical protein